MKGVPSRMAATAYNVEGATSVSSLAMEESSSSEVVFRPTLTSDYLSVLAVHRTMTESKLFECLKALMSPLILSTNSCLDPCKILSARSS